MEPVCKWKIHTLLWEKYEDRSVGILINDWIIKNGTNKKIVLRKLKLCKNNVLMINFTTNNKLELIFSSIFLNIDIHTFRNMGICISKLIDGINKIFYLNYSSNYVIDDFFIKCISVNSVNVKASYYPENCDYLGLLGGNLVELHKITNYQNIDLCLKKVINHYPYNFSLMFIKILKEWLRDIYKNQLGKVVKGTVFSATVDNTAAKYSKECFKKLKQGFKVLISHL